MSDMTESFSRLNFPPALRTQRWCRSIRDARHVIGLSLAASFPFLSGANSSSRSTSHTANELEKNQVWSTAFALQLPMYGSDGWIWWMDLMDGWIWCMDGPDDDMTDGWWMDLTDVADRSPASPPPLPGHECGVICFRLQLKIVQLIIGISTLP